MEIAPACMGATCERDQPPAWPEDAEGCSVLLEWRLVPRDHANAAKLNADTLEAASASASAFRATAATALAVPVGRLGIRKTLVLPDCYLNEIIDAANETESQRTKVVRLLSQVGLWRKRWTEQATQAVAELLGTTGCQGHTAIIHQLFRKLYRLAADRDHKDAKPPTVEFTATGAARVEILCCIMTHDPHSDRGCCTLEDSHATELWDSVLSQKLERHALASAQAVNLVTNSSSSAERPAARAKLSSPGRFSGPNPVAEEITAAQASTVAGKHSISIQRPSSAPSAPQSEALLRSVSSTIRDNLRTRQLREARQERVAILQSLSNTIRENLRLRQAWEEEGAIFQGDSLVFL